jgi:hypothetical protein
VRNAIKDEYVRQRKWQVGRFRDKRLPCAPLDWLCTAKEEHVMRDKASEVL